MKAWIGVDLDGTIAEYSTFKGPAHIGAPIPAMVNRVKNWLAEGKEVRIFTARVYAPALTDLSVSATEYDQRGIEARIARKAIEDWCLLHIGQKLKVTCQKDYGMVELWDDRAIQVVKNTGLRADLDDIEDADTENTFCMGAQVIQTIRLKPQRIYLHPFTMGALLTRDDFNGILDIHKYPKGHIPPPTVLTPLSEQELYTLAQIAKMNAASH